MPRPASEARRWRLRRSGPDKARQPAVLDGDDERAVTMAAQSATRRCAVRSVARRCAALGRRCPRTEGQYLVGWAAWSFFFFLHLNNSCHAGLSMCTSESANQHPSQQNRD
ncbi:hypothetical protein SEVIR_3G166550v4 [Setaria viridis]